MQTRTGSGFHGFLGSVWSGNSEGLLVACVFGAGLAGLDRRPGPSRVDSEPWVTSRPHSIHAQGS